jgi:hypothetical protein
MPSAGHSPGREVPHGDRHAAERPRCERAPQSPRGTHRCRDGKTQQATAVVDDNTVGIDQEHSTVRLDLARLALPLASMRLRAIQMLTVAKLPPQWLVVGATSHWSAMAPFHSEGLGCARCLHNMATVDSVMFSFGLHGSALNERHVITPPSTDGLHRSKPRARLSRPRGRSHPCRRAWAARPRPGFRHRPAPSRHLVRGRCAPGCQAG